MVKVALAVLADTITLMRVIENHWKVGTLAHFVELINYVVGCGNLAYDVNPKVHWAQYTALLDILPTVWLLAKLQTNEN